MEVGGWILDKSAAARAAEPEIGDALEELAGTLFICAIGELEQLYSARSARQHDELKAEMHATFGILSPPPDVFERALELQRDLAHHHGMWHRTPIPDLLIAETALHHGMGVVHLDGDYDRITQVRRLPVKRLGR